MIRLISGAITVAALIEAHSEDGLTDLIFKESAKRWTASRVNDRALMDEAYAQMIMDLFGTSLMASGAHRLTSAIFRSGWDWATSKALGHSGDDTRS